MMIQKIEIWDYANIEHYATSFDPQFVFLEGGIAEEVMTAAGILTGYPLLRSSFGRKLARKGSRICGEIEISGKNRVFWCRWDPRKKRFLYFEENAEGEMVPGERLFELMIGSCEEQDISRYFEKNKREFIGKMKRYEKPDSYYPREEFAKMTNGFGCTSTFRVYTRDFLRTYKAETGTDNPAFEEFLKVNAFWMGFEKLRNLNYEAMPLFIDDMPFDAQYLKLVKSLERQIFWRVREGNAAQL